MLEMPSHTYQQLRQFEHSIYHTSLVYTTNNLNKVMVSDLHIIHLHTWLTSGSSLVLYTVYDQTSEELM